MIDALPGFGVLAHAGADVAIQGRIGEAQVILVGLAAEAVDGRLFNKHIRQAQRTAHGLDLLHGEMGQGREIAHGIAVARGIAHPVLREIAGVGHAAVHALGNRVHGAHAQARRQILHRLRRNLRQGGFQLRHHALIGVMNVDDHAANAQVLYQSTGNVDIKLLAVGHQHAHHAVRTQRLGAQRGHNGAVLAAGDAQHGAAALPVRVEPLANPFHNFVFDLQGVKLHGKYLLQNQGFLLKSTRGSPSG